MLWLLSTAALASGVVRPDVRVVDPACATRSLEAPLTPPLYLTGVVRASSSAPGGPVQHHTFPLDPSGLVVTRQGCRAPEAGRFVVVGACGEGVMVRYQGALQPGVIYEVGARDAWHVEVTTAGSATRGGCPGDPLAFGATDDKTWGAPAVHEVAVPRERFSVDRAQHTLTLPRGVASEATGLSPLHGPLGHWLEDDEALPEVVPMTITVRPYRHRYEVDDERGRVWCVDEDAAMVEVTLPALDMTSSLGWAAQPVRSRTRGYCP